MGLADRPPDKGVQPLVSAQLLLLQMAQGMKHDGPLAASIGMDAKRDLLGHHPTGQECGGRLRQDLRHLSLKLTDDPALAVQVNLRIGRDLRQILRSAARAVGMKEPCAASPERQYLGERGLQRLVRRHGTRLVLAHRLPP